MTNNVTVPTEVKKSEPEKTENEGDLGVTTIN